MCTPSVPVRCWCHRTGTTQVDASVFPSPGGLAPLLPAYRRHRPVRLAPVLLLTQGLALVVLLLALRQRDLDLGPAVLEVQGEGHDRVTRLLGLGLQLVDLLAVQEQLALAAHGVVGPRALVILGDVGVV